MSEDKIKKCLVQELKELNDKLKHYDWREESRDIYMANCIGYAQALCWVLGRDRLYELLQNNIVIYNNQPRATKVARGFFFFYFF